MGKGTAVAEGKGEAQAPGARGKGKTRFLFIDQFRGLVGIMMALGHSSYYFNAVWRSLDPLDPFFSNFGQFALRYMGYLCAPGFLMMNGAMSWYSYTRRIQSGKSEWSSKWHLIQRGLFLVLVQVTWVNSSWGGFRTFRPDHIGIIACIGLSMVLLSLFVNARVQIRLAIGLLAFAIHPLLLQIHYDPKVAWQLVLMQTFVDAGSFNKYPVIPWFGLATMGSVMAEGWLSKWKTYGARVQWSLLIAVSAFVLATIVRMARGYGNIDPFYTFGHYSFFLDQKYPPSLYHNLWFFGAVVFMVTVIMSIGQILPWLTKPLGTVGRVPLFFYCVHIALLGIISKRMGLYYHQGGVAASFIGWVALLIVMYPLALWFGKVKQKSKNHIIQMI
ncbi:MAG: DUF1624 domain-containing protein [Candidatus Eisenbacteria bacterium]|nr:heparan-alpha-glucosaminide N-acetyltransferase domain-containing protein [Candidatus Eisenbacteria bacterium]